MREFNISRSCVGQMPDYLHLDCCRYLQSFPPSSRLRAYLFYSAKAHPFIYGKSNLKYTVYAGTVMLETQKPWFWEFQVCSNNILCTLLVALSWRHHTCHLQNFIQQRPWATRTVRSRQPMPQEVHCSQHTDTHAFRLLISTIISPPT